MVNYVFKKVKNAWFGKSKNTSFGASTSGSNPLRAAYFTESRNIERQRQTIKITEDDLKEYISLRETEDLTEKWIKHVNIFLTSYLNYCNFEISKNKTLEYLNSIRRVYHKTTYRKRLLQVRKFIRYLGLDWLEYVKIIPEPTLRPKRVSDKDINACLTYFEGDKYEVQARAIIMLGKSTGMRPTELYRLKLEDIDFENRSIQIHKSKTGKPRTVFFNEEAKKDMLEYFRNKPSYLRLLFGEHHCQLIFRNAPIQIKDLRKYFLQAWNKRGGQYLVGEILTGHSIRGNISLSHYVTFSQEELKAEYDRVMN